MDPKQTQRTALIIASLSSFLTPFMVSAVNIALPAIGKTFKADAVLLSWIATAYLLAAAVSLVPFGKLADIYGRKRIYLLGMVLFAISSWLAALSGSVPLLIFFRIFQGVGTAMIFATGMAILTSVFPPQERGKVLGIAVAAVYAGLSCGPFIGGYLTQHIGWRSIFLINLPIGALIILLVIFKLKGEWSGDHQEKFDLFGALIYGLGLVAIMYGISALPVFRSIGLIAAGIMALAGFIKWERYVRHPVFEVTLFVTNRVFTFSCLAALIHYSATFAVTFLLSLYLQYIKGLSPQSAGIVLISQPIMMALFSPPAGRLSDKIEPRIIASLGMTLTASGLILLAFLDQGTGVAFIVGSLMILGFGYALFSSPNMNAIMSSVDRRLYGLASGSVGTMRLLGQMLSMGMTTLIFTLLLGREQIAPELYPELVASVRVALIMFSILCIPGIYFSLTRGELRPGAKMGLH